MSATEGIVVLRWCPIRRVGVLERSSFLSCATSFGLQSKGSPGAVQQKASSLGLSTKPTNKSPFGTGGKRRGR